MVWRTDGNTGNLFISADASPNGLEDEGTEGTVITGGATITCRKLDYRKSKANMKNRAQKG